jgi:AraC family transcriptional regulator
MSGVHEFGRRSFSRVEVLLSSTGRHWKGMAAEARNHPACKISPPVPHQVEIKLALADSPTGRVERRGNGEFQDTAARPGTLWLCPFGVVEEAIRITDDLSRILHMYLGQEICREISDAVSRPVLSESISNRADIEDDFLRQVGYRISAERQEETSVGGLLVDSLAWFMTAHLVAKYRGPIIDDGHSLVIDHVNIRRVVYFIYDNLGQILL